MGAVGPPASEHFDVIKPNLRHTACMYAAYVADTEQVKAGRERGVGLSCARIGVFDLFVLFFSDYK